MKLNTMLYFTCILLITCDMNLPNIMMKETIICKLNSSHTLSKGTNWEYTSQDEGFSPPQPQPIEPQPNKNNKNIS